MQFCIARDVKTKKVSLKMGTVHEVLVCLKMYARIVFVSEV